MSEVKLFYSYAKLLQCNDQKEIDQLLDGAADRWLLRAHPQALQSTLVHLGIVCA